jgi:hypothetical protein
MLFIRFVLFVGLVGVASVAVAAPVDPVVTAVVSVSGTSLYDPDSQHLWNRLHEALFIRIDPKTRERFGEDDPDPLIWRNSKYPLEGASHAKVLAVFDEFLAKHGERLITDPRRRYSAICGSSSIGRRRKCRVNTPCRLGR